MAVKGPVAEVAVLQLPAFRVVLAQALQALQFLVGKPRVVARAVQALAGGTRVAVVAAILGAVLGVLILAPRLIALGYARVDGARIVVVARPVVGRVGHLVRILVAFVDGAVDAVVLLRGLPRQADSFFGVAALHAVAELAVVALGPVALPAGPAAAVGAAFPALALGRADVVGGQVQVAGHVRRRDVCGRHLALAVGQVAAGIGIRRHVLQRREGLPLDTAGRQRDRKEEEGD